MSLCEQVRSGAFAAGTWCSLGSSAAAEIAALCGYDWVLLDGEHAPSTTTGLMAQMQALNASLSAPVVRIPWHDRVFIKWALDIGAAGIMVPYVENGEQAKQLVTWMRYPPQGERGVAGAMRACGYGLNIQTYLAEANDNTLAIMQIENQNAIDNCRDIARVDGVDVLFVGPMDLSTSLGMPKRFADPAFMDVLWRIAQETRAEGKACGILLPNTDLLPKFLEIGYTFVAVSSDINILTAQLKSIEQRMRKAAS